MMLQETKKHWEYFIKERRQTVKKVEILDMDTPFPDFSKGLRIRVTALDMVSNKLFISSTEVSESFLEDSNENIIVDMLWEMIDSAVETSRSK